MLTRYSSDGAVAAANHLAASAGVAAMRRGGNAVDAIIAAAAVMAVVAPDMCGLGGDLFALVSLAGEPPAALNASGRSGSGADADRLRADGHRLMPFVGDIRAVTVPGCVDGLIALHERFATVELGELFEGRPAARRTRLPGVADACGRVGGARTRSCARPCSAQPRPCGRVSACASRVSPRCSVGSRSPVAPASMKQTRARSCSSSAPASSARRTCAPATPTGWRRSAFVHSDDGCGRRRRTPRATWRCRARGSPTRSACPTIPTTNAGRSC